MRRWQLPVAVSGYYIDDLHGRIDYDFADGEVVARSEQEEVALGHLTSLTFDVNTGPRDELTGLYLPDEDGVVPVDTVAMAVELEPLPDPAEAALAKETKAQLLERAAALGITGVDDASTKAEIIAAIEAHPGGNS